MKLFTITFLFPINDTDMLYKKWIAISYIVFCALFIGALVLYAEWKLALIAFVISLFIVQDVKKLIKR